VDWIESLVNAPIATLLAIVGLAFIVIAIFGRIGTWVELNQKRQRIIVAMLGGLFLVIGIGLERVPIADKSATQPEPSVTVSSPESKPSPTSTTSATPPSSPATQPSRSQIFGFFENAWESIRPTAFEAYQEDEHPVTGQKRDSFLIREEKLNSLGISTKRINVTVAQLGDEWTNNAPDTWNDTDVRCFIKVQRQDGSLSYLPCQIFGSSGRCDLPWQLDTSGRRCGGRAASERSGG
jgi:hypothetical protein